MSVAGDSGKINDDKWRPLDKIWMMIKATVFTKKNFQLYSTFCWLSTESIVINAYDAQLRKVELGASNWLLFMFPAEFSWELWRLWLYMSKISILISQLFLASSSPCPISWENHFSFGKQTKQNYKVTSHRELLCNKYPLRHTDPGNKIEDFFKNCTKPNQ